jgi:hypothetical protein
MGGTKEETMSGKPATTRRPEESATIERVAAATTVTDLTLDPDLVEFAEEFAAAFEAGLAAVVAQAPVEETELRNHASRSESRAVDRAVVRQLAAMDRITRADAVARARHFLAEPDAVGRRRFRPGAEVDLLKADFPVDAALAHVSDAALRKAMTAVVTRTSSALAADAGAGEPVPAGKGLAASSDFTIPADQNQLERTYQRYKAKLGGKVGSPHLVKDHKDRTVLVQRTDNGVVIFSDRAQALWGTIYNRFRELGGVPKFPGGPPKTDVQVFKDGGAGAEFHDGYSLYRAEGGNVSMLFGAVRKEWIARGGRTSVGYPLSDVKLTPDAEGRIARFTNGLVVWHPTFGAHYIPEPAAHLWRTEGTVFSTLGYPLQAPATNPSAAHQQNPTSPYYTQRFQGGSIVQVAGDLPPTAQYPVEEVHLVLKRLEAQRKASEGLNSIVTDSVHLGGTRLAVNGKAKIVQSVHVGHFHNEQSKPVNKTITAWPLVVAPTSIHRWPAAFSFTGIYWADSRFGSGGPQAVLEAWKEIAEKVDAVVAEGAKKLGELAASYTGPALGNLVGTVVGALLKLLVHAIFKAIAKAAADEIFEPFVIAASLQDAWQPGTVIGQVLGLRTEEHDPPGTQKPGIYISDFEFRKAQGK